MSSRFTHGLESESRTRDVQIQDDVDFKSLFLPDPLVKGLNESGFKKPSPIQLKALPMARCGLDILVQAKSGTGKTLVFALVVLEFVKIQLNRVQVIILTPTREIALQIADVLETIGCHLKGLNIGTFIGGIPLHVDAAKVEKCHVAVGAPGRIKHLILLGLLDTKSVRLFVLDEADQLIGSTFQEDIDDIFSHVPTDKQMLTCSATYTKEHVKYLSKYMSRPKLVTPEGACDAVLIGLRQFVTTTPFLVASLAQLFAKQERLVRLLSTLPFDQCIVFSNYFSRAESICNMLKTEGWSAAWLAGLLDQGLRIDVLRRFKTQEARVLVTTDLAARGIDAPSVNLIINMDVPRDYRTYLHRMGRAGRYGSHGLVITILSSEMEVTYFRQMLGKIQGPSMSVSVIPDDLRIDLWTAEDSRFEQLYGIEPKGGTDRLEEKDETLFLSDEDAVATKEHGKRRDTKKEKKTKKKTDRGQKSTADGEVEEPKFEIMKWCPVEDRGPKLSFDDLKTSLDAFVADGEDARRLVATRRERQKSPDIGARRAPEPPGYYVGSDTEVRSSRHSELEKWFRMWECQSSFIRMYAQSYSGLE